jgi:hypothetical protein
MFSISANPASGALEARHSVVVAGDGPPSMMQDRGRHLATLDLNPNKLRGFVFAICRCTRKRRARPRARKVQRLRDVNC